MAEKNPEERQKEGIDPVHGQHRSRRANSFESVIPLGRRITMANWMGDLNALAT